MVTAPGTLTLLLFGFAMFLSGCFGNDATSKKAEGGEQKTIIDLSDDWTPYLFSESNGQTEKTKPNAFKKTFVALADERPVVSPSQRAARAAYVRSLSPGRRRRFLEAPDEPSSHLYLEVYGIPPTLSVLRRRALEEVTRRCFDTVDFNAISAFDGFLVYSNNGTARARAEKGHRLSEALKGEMAGLGFATLGEYRANVRDRKRKEEIELAIEYEAVRQAQKQLTCEGLLNEKTSAPIEGGLDHETHLALRRFERKNRIFGWGYFGGETLTLLATDPKKRLYETLVRVITERVTDAAGIIEDGTATANGESAVYRRKDGTISTVRNLVRACADAVLKALDIRSIETGLAFLKSGEDDRFKDFKVGVRLPPMPPYYSAKMRLKIEIDPGDVYYDYPYDGAVRRSQKRAATPLLTLKVAWRDQEIPLVKMKTSIGGWQSELAADGYVYLKYKGSEAGDGVIQEIIAAPTWMPPESTPVEELMTTATYRKRGVTVPDMDAVGPWYTSAYGLVAAVHLNGTNDEPSRFEDKGIRSHGSYDYTSISKRYSHGCHRLYNHLAVRLYDFVLRRTPHRRIGQRIANRTRRLVHNTADYRIDVDTDGYIYALDMPIPVSTLRGRILGKRKVPILRYMPKPGVPYGPDAVLLGHRR